MIRICQISLCLAFLYRSSYICYCFFCFYQTTRSNEQAKKEWYEAYVPLEQLHLYESEQLHTYQWIDQAKGIVKVAIDIVMVELVKEHESK